MAEGKRIRIQLWKIKFLVLFEIVSFTLSGGVCWAQESSLFRIQHALELLQRSNQGQFLLGRAIKIWNINNFKDLARFIKWGNSSRTDTVLTRHYNPKSGKEERERETTIYLRKEQPELDLVLDLAHELVHATARPSFDPYDPSLTLGKYVYAAIEGEGGEVDAVVGECRVNFELSDVLKSSISRCLPYIEEDRSGRPGGINREEVRRDFYKVGKWQANLVKNLGSEVQLFPMLSDEPPGLYSSTGHTPYPVSLAQEYEEITEIACTNSKNRIGLASASHFPFIKSLSLKSAFANGDDSTQQDVRRFIAKRCQ